MDNSYCNGKTQNSSQWWYGSSLCPEDLRSHTENWALSSDAATATILQNLSEKILKRASEVETILSKTVKKTDQVRYHIANINNTYLSLANLQFIESKIAPDDVLPQHAPANSKSSEERTLKNAIELGINLANSAYEKLEISDSDTEDEIKGSPLHVYKPINPYEERSLPHIIGSSAFLEDDSLGITGFISTSETEKLSESESDENSLLGLPSTDIPGTHSSFMTKISSDSDWSDMDSIPERSNESNQYRSSSRNSSRSSNNISRKSSRLTSNCRFSNLALNSDSNGDNEDDDDGLFSKKSLFGGSVRLPSDVLKTLQKPAKTSTKTIIPATTRVSSRHTQQKKKKKKGNSLFDSDSEDEGLFSKTSSGTMRSSSGTSLNSGRVAAAQKVQTSAQFSNTDSEDGAVPPKQHGMSIVEENDVGTSIRRKVPIGGVNIFSSNVTQAIERQKSSGSVSSSSDLSNKDKQRIQSTGTSNRTTPSPKPSTKPKTKKLNSQSLFSDDAPNSTDDSQAPSHPIPNTSSADSFLRPKQSRIVGGKNSLFSDSDDELFTKALPKKTLYVNSQIKSSASATSLKPSDQSFNSIAGRKPAINPIASKTPSVPRPHPKQKDKKTKLFDSSSSDEGLFTKAKPSKTIPEIQSTVEAKLKTGKNAKTLPIASKLSEGLKKRPTSVSQLSKSSHGKGIFGSSSDDDLFSTPIAAKIPKEAAPVAKNPKPQFQKRDNGPPSVPRAGLKTAHQPNTQSSTQQPKHLSADMSKITRIPKQRGLFESSSDDDLFSALNTAPIKPSIANKADTTERTKVHDSHVDTRSSFKALSNDETSPLLPEVDDGSSLAEKELNSNINQEKNAEELPNTPPPPPLHEDIQEASKQKSQTHFGLSGDGGPPPPSISSTAKGDVLQNKTKTEPSAALTDQTDKNDHPKPLFTPPPLPEDNNCQSISTDPTKRSYSNHNSLFGSSSSDDDIFSPPTIKSTATIEKICNLQSSVSSGSHSNESSSQRQNVVENEAPFKIEEDELAASLSPNLQVRDYALRSSIACDINTSQVLDENDAPKKDIPSVKSVANIISRMNERDETSSKLGRSQSTEEGGDDRAGDEGQLTSEDANDSHMKPPESTERESIDHAQKISETINAEIEAISHETDGNCLPKEPKEVLTDVKRKPIGGVLHFDKDELKSKLSSIYKNPISPKATSATERIKHEELQKRHSFPVSLHSTRDHSKLFEDKNYGEVAVSFDEPLPKSTLVSLTKGRPRVQQPRRPPSRLYRPQSVFMDEVDVSTEQAAQPASPKAENPPEISSNEERSTEYVDSEKPITDAISKPQNQGVSKIMSKSHLKSETKSPPRALTTASHSTNPKPSAVRATPTKSLVKNLPKRSDFPKSTAKKSTPQKMISDSPKLPISSKKTPSKPSINKVPNRIKKSLFDDDEDEDDLFGAGGATFKKNPPSVANAATSSSDVASKIPADAKSVGTKDASITKATTNNLKPKTSRSLFSDDDDDDNDIFTNVPKGSRKISTDSKSVQKAKLSLFDDDEEANDLFASKFDAAKKVSNKPAATRAASVARRPHQMKGTLKKSTGPIDDPLLGGSK